MVTAPAATPATAPPLTVATDALLLLHEPPGADSDKVIDEPAHTLVNPDILPAYGSALTAIGFVATALPQELVTVYLIVSTPPDTPVTKPPDTVALPLLLLHRPPAAPSVSVIDAPWHTLEAPLIVPATGANCTVTEAESTIAPQLLAME